MLMVNESKWTPMSMDDEAFLKNAEPLSDDEIKMNGVLISLGLDPIRRRPAPACPWPREQLRAEIGETCHLVIVTEPQQEVRTTVTLQSFRVPYCLPMVPHITTRGVRRTKVKCYRPMLRGYILIPESACDQIVDLHRRQPLPIHGFLRFGDRLAVVPEREVRKLCNIEKELDKPKPVQSIWSVGETARISEGPFWGLNCTITDLANGERITVEVSLFGRAVPMRIDEASLEKL